MLLDELKEQGYHYFLREHLCVSQICAWECRTSTVKSGQYTRAVLSSAPWVSVLNDAVSAGEKAHKPSSGSLL